MAMLQQLKNAPFILKPKKHILLLSHMRAYTSLLGHIFGNNPEIEGYYEMHTGYFSWKSRYKVKLMYCQEHRANNNAKFIFDKVLHNEHWVNPNLLTQNNFYPMIAIRRPEATIRSIVAHYQKVNPDHEYNNLALATNYYKERLLGLADIANKTTNHYLYFDAEAIKTKTDESLATMSSFLGLSSTLTPNYKKMEKTGARFSGDNSKELFSGAIQTQQKIRDEAIEGLAIDNNIINLYQEVRSTLMNNAKLNIEG